MLLRLLPQHPGQLSIPNLWQQLHSHFHNNPDDTHLTTINDDLVGSFNSVPQQRLVDAVISLCNRWQSQHLPRLLRQPLSPRELTYLAISERSFPF